MEIQNTIGIQFKSLKIIHGALCIGAFIILVIMRFLVQQDPIPKALNIDTFQIVGAVIGFVTVLSSRMLFFIKTKSALSVPSIKGKIDIYRIALIIQIAILEGGSILNAVLYFITKNDLHFFIALGLLLFMIFGRPTRMMAGMLLFNTKEDRQQIYNDSLAL